MYGDFPVYEYIELKENTELRKKKKKILVSFYRRISAIKLKMEIYCSRNINFAAHNVAMWAANVLWDGPIPPSSFLVLVCFCDRGFPIVEFGTINFY